MSVLGPLGVERRCLLSLSFVSAVVSFSIGLSTLLRAKRDRTYINQVLVPHGIIDIGIYDMFTSGAVITAICALLALLSSVFCAFTWYPINHGVSFFRYQAWSLFLCAAWLFATLVTYDYLFAHRSAPTTINLHGLPVPEAVIQRLADFLNFSYAYQDVYFWRLLAVIPWFAFVFAVASGVMLQLAANRASASALNAQQGKKHDRTAPQVQA